MKSYNEMNLKERKAYNNIENAAIDYIFGLENGCFDSQKGSEEYNNYYEQISDLETLIPIVYGEAINAIYTDDGAVLGGRTAKQQIKDIRFCGKEFLMEVTTYFCKKYQAEVLEDLQN